MNNNLRVKLRKYNSILSGTFCAVILISFFIIIIPYGWYLGGDSYILEEFNNPISLTYKNDNNINKINSVYYRYVLPFFYIFIAILSIKIYQIDCQINNLKCKGVYKNTVKLSKNSKIKMINIFPIIFVIAFAWVYLGKPSYEKSGLAIMRVADSTIFGFALLNASMSIFLAALFFTNVVCIYDYYLCKKNNQL